MRNTLALGAIATGALAMAGCGGGGKSTATTAASTAASAPAQTTATSTSASAAGAPETVGTKPSKLGTILAAGPKRLTVYIFEADRGSSSSCSEGCKAVWPPVQPGSAPVPGGSARGADLGVITRSDGTKQVTYKRHPLYFYSRDGDNGDAYGEGIKSFGADWYVLSPSGNKVDTS
jgi:predicted lipoprotein with Yx(FWY)xxD motif